MLRTVFRRAPAVSATPSLFARTAPALGLRPLGDRVLVTKDAPSRESSAGLVLPKEEKVVQATVVSVGPGKPDAPCSLKTGDRVLLPEWGGQRVRVEGEDQFLFRESEILGVIE
eukprot:TRINITY_DN70274_c0_g1_i1.p2 TRINITY_DN70274_c0_g1~~TRINITY_DN70274_c0_g1_i1.p2  ORF type:complete len:114 (+),score=23.09 TRINITY_DN70274_c0_g1_i1:64-405(+)